MSFFNKPMDSIQKINKSTQSHLTKAKHLVLKKKKKQRQSIKAKHKQLSLD